MKNPKFSKRILVVAIGATFAAVISSAAAHTERPAAQSLLQPERSIATAPAAATTVASNDRRTSRGTRSKSGSEKSAKPAAAKYPEATRKNPEIKASERNMRKMSKMADLYDEQKGPEALLIAEEIIADPKANAYEKAYSAQLGAQIAYDADDIAKAINYYQQVLEFDGLDNNSHYGIMLNLAQLQQQEEQYAEAQRTFDRFFSETGSKDATAMMVKGQGLYLMERYAEAAVAMKQAIEAEADPKPEWMALLMQAYVEGGNLDEAIRTGEQVAASKPGDKRAQLNLVAIYQQADMPQKALAVLEKLRASNQLDTANEYKVLYSSYAGIEGRDQDVIDVINDGFQKGVLEPDYNTYLALAQAYYFSDQPAQAITAYQKAAPLAADGETYLNLARVLQQENRIAEAKAAARQALAKGIKKAKDANVIIALPGN
ncbi:MAG: tetratricopeptide repeat protein [Lysobacter sp.]